MGVRDWQLGGMAMPSAQPLICARDEMAGDFAGFARRA